MQRWQIVHTKSESLLRKIRLHLVDERHDRVLSENPRALRSFEHVGNTLGRVAR